MFCERKSVTITTDTNGDATDYVGSMTGKIIQIQYVKDDYDNGSTITITGEDTAIPILAETGINASATRSPRQATHSVAGVAATYDGTRAVFDDICIERERVKIVVSSGGNTKSGTFHVTVGG